MSVLRLANSVFPYLFQFRSIFKCFLFRVCTSEARSKPSINRFEKKSKSFRQMDHDKSFLSVSQIVISPIEEMEDKVQTAASSQAEHQLNTSEGLEEGLVEVREASPASSVNDEVVTMQNHVARTRQW